MSRQLNVNKPPAAVTLLAQGLCDDGTPVMIAVVPDPNNAGRAALVMPDCDLGTGGMTLTVLAVGFQQFSTRATIPMPGQQEEGPSLTLEPVSPFPEPPTRAVACSIRCHFQGLWVQSKTFSENYKRFYGGPDGGVPFFGGAFQDFWAVGDGDQILDQLAAVGDTHCMMTWGHGGVGYNQANQPYGLNQLIPPANQTEAEYLAMVDHVIARGFQPVYIINGEGNPDEIRATFEGFVQTLRSGGIDRTAYGVILISYDGVWPASWTVDDMTTTIPWMRAVLGPVGYLGCMYGVGPGGNAYMWVIDSNDYVQPWCDGLDVMLTTDSPGEAEGVSMANKAQYMMRAPNFSQYQPSYSGHFVFVPNSRGERFWGNIEWDTYGTVRDPNQTLKPAIDAARALMVTMEVPCIG